MSVKREVRVFDIPSVDPCVVAASLSDKDEVVGAFVVVLRTNGELTIGLAGADDQGAMQPLIDIAGVVEKHCDARLVPGKPPSNGPASDAN